MDKILFKNNAEPAINATNLNLLQDNVENAIEGKGTWNTLNETYGINCRKNNDNIVEININKFGISATIDSYGELIKVTLPTDYVPDKEIRSPLWARSSDSNTFIGNLVLFIGTDGTLSILNSFASSVQINAINGTLLFKV